MQGTSHGADPLDRKRFRPGRDLYLACRGRLVVMNSSVNGWATATKRTRQVVEDAIYGKVNSPDAKAIRAELAAELGLEVIEEDDPR